MGRMKETFMQILEDQGMQNDPYWTRRIEEAEAKWLENEEKKSLRKPSWLSKIICNLRVRKSQKNLLNGRKI